MPKLLHGRYYIGALALTFIGTSVWRGPAKKNSSAPQPSPPVGIKFIEWKSMTVAA